MSGNYNKCMLMGRLTRDPEMRYSASGTAICSFGVAVGKKYKAADGEWKEKTGYFECTVFSKRAEVVNSYFSKGSGIFVEGELDYQTWETKEGQKRNTIRVLVNDFQFVGGKVAKEEVKSETADVPEGDIPF